MNYSNLGINLFIIGIIIIACFIVLCAEIEVRCTKKYPKVICTVALFIVLGLYISVLICIDGKHLDSSYTYEEVPIDKMTDKVVYFGDELCKIDASNTIIEYPTEGYDNVVIVEIESYQVQWICRINLIKVTYHIYLTEDIYDALDIDKVIYSKPLIGKEKSS